MSSLFIIGNGFDLAHGLKTSYEDFHQYLIHRYPDYNTDVLIAPELSIGRHGEEIYNKDEVVGLIIKLINETDGEYWE